MDDFGDRMKGYEQVETARRFDQTFPVYARIDGRGFSKFTKGMNRPFDPRMTEAMISVTRYLVTETHALIGYTQSDEISLVWMSPSEESEIFFGGKIQKMTSVLASMAAAKMAQAIRGWSPFEDRLPHFDARVFQLPDQMEAANAFLWRERDAKKNSVSMAARHFFSHSVLQGASQLDMLSMLENVDVNFDDYPQSFKRGTWLRRETFERKFTQEELERIPEKNRPDPDTPILRSEVRELSIPDFGLVSNRVGVIFDGETPRG